MRTYTSPVVINGPESLARLDETLRLNIDAPSTVQEWTREDTPAGLESAWRDSLYRAFKADCARTPSEFYAWTEFF